MSVLLKQRSLDQIGNISLFEPKRTRLSVIQNRIYLGKDSLVLQESVVRGPTAVTVLRLESWCLVIRNWLMMVWGKEPYKRHVRKIDLPGGCQCGRFR